MIKRYLSALVFFLLLFQPTYSQNIFFSEGFNGAFPADWTAVKRLGNNHPASNWRRTITGPQGSYATESINSTTASGGWMIYDSDVTCTTPQNQDQDAWLISPPIDASAHEIVWLIFETYYRSFNDRPAIRIGSNLNDLDNWENIEVFPGIFATQFGGVIEGDQALNPQIIYMNLTESLAGQSNLRFAFQFLSTSETDNGGDLIGCAFNWQIDDVKLADYDPRPDTDIRVNAFFGVAPNAITPVTQIEPIGFLADIRNSGKTVQASTTLFVTIENSAGEVVHQDSLLFGPIAPDSTVQNVFFQSEYMPPPVSDEYTATYFARTATPDEVPSNNNRSFIFEISDTLFAKQRGANEVITASGSNSYTFGNVFYVPNGSGLHARFLSFGIANPNQLSGKTVNTYLYRWTGDENNDFLANPEEYGGGPVAANSYTFTGNEGNNLIAVPVDFEGGSIALEPDAHYIAAVEYQTTTQQQLFMRVSTEYDYHAAYLYNDSMMHPRYAAVIDVGNTGSLDWTGFGLDLVPVVRLSVGQMTTTTTGILPEGSAKIFPNPVSDQATLILNLPKTSDEVLLHLYDTKGALHWQRRLSHVQQESIPLQFNRLDPGVYWLRVRTDSGMATLTVTVQ
ncbi:MAG: T9SS type A sorting domain-containing protein [Saprospiraceae bacterium]